MKKQKEKKEILDGFKPSKGDESYLNPGADKEFLAELGMGLTRDLTKSAEHMLAAGDKLREARKRLPADRAYSKWCKDYAPGVSARVLLNMRSVAEDPQLRKIMKKGHLAFGSVAELLSASDKLVEEVLASDEPMTVKETREKVKEEKPGAPTSADLESAEAFERSMHGGNTIEELDKKIADAKAREAESEEERSLMPTPADVIAKHLQSPVAERVQAFLDQGCDMDTYWAFFIYGLAVTWDDDQAPNRAETEARYSGYAKICHPDTGGKDDLMAMVNEARDVIHNYYVS